MKKEIYYCNECYEKNKKQLDNIIPTEFEIFLEKYKNTTITNKILEEEIKCNKNFNYEKLMSKKYTYNCPICENKEKIKDCSTCDECGLIICDKKCSKIKKKCTKEIKNKVEYIICKNCWTEENDFDMFIEKYKDKIITNEIFINEIKTHEEYNYSDISDEYNYECPKCKEITPIEETYFCEECDILVCDNKCINEITEKCNILNCYYCRRGICNNNTTHLYCEDCYVDENKEFYEKYKNKIITQEILDVNDINIADFVNEGYNLKYKCQICNEEKDFNNEALNECNNCCDTICNECCRITYNGCNRYNCRFCENETCYYGEHICICYKCFPNKDKREKRPISPSILSTNVETQCCVCLINVKKYACIPCGHLCLCGQCSIKIEKKCPICKNESTDIIKIYN